MLVRCAKSIFCNADIQAQGFDYPVANFSSERPDADIFIAPNYGWDYNVAPLGTTYTTPGCVGWCSSTVSQEEADLCAARQQILCLTNNPTSGGGGSGGGGGPSNPTINPPTVTPGPGPVPGTSPTLYGNTVQTCNKACPDGTVFSSTIDAGQVVAKSQSQADSIAYSLACKDAAKKMNCQGGLNGFACSDPFHENPEYMFQFSGTTQNPPLTWATTGGSIPPGLTLEPGGSLHGFPSTAGSYSFTVQSTDAVGNKGTKVCTFNVLGLDNTTGVLPDTKVDQPYSYQIQASGGATFFSITNGSLPTGLTMDAGGLITGTPTSLGGSLFTVTVEDGFLHSCSMDLVLNIVGPKITCPPAGQVCVVYAGDVTASTVGCVFSGTPPANLAMTGAGHITGTPKTVAPFLVTATDPSGHINNKLCTFITNAGQPASIQDIGAWSFLHSGDGSGTGGISAGLGALTASYVWGSTGAPGNCDWNGGNSQSTSPDFRNCGAAYNATVRVDYTIPATPCPNNPSHVPGGALQMLLNGSLIMDHSSLGPLFSQPASGTFSVVVAIPANSTGNHFTAYVAIQGGGTFTINVTITPLTPP